ncbi:hypothetical protein [Marinicella rhabdoformis]|nr:hypothetical protein [Marinicella rhabdoformis]
MTSVHELEVFCRDNSVCVDGRQTNSESPMDGVYRITLNDPTLGDDDML